MLKTANTLLSLRWTPRVVWKWMKKEIDSVTPDMSLIAHPFFLLINRKANGRSWGGTSLTP